MGKKERKIVANNKKARHDYFIEEVYEAGIVLTGTEIKSVRAGKVSIKESYARLQNGELVIIGICYPSRCYRSVLSIVDMEALP